MNILSELFDLQIFWDYRETLLSGLAQNVTIFILSAILATAIAFVVALLRTGSNRYVQFLAAAYAEIFRNTPEYILLVWVYYIFPILLTGLLKSKFDISPFWAAIIALGAAYSGFLSETVRSGLMSVPRGHTEAASALGMTSQDIRWRIIIPQAVRRMLPEALNQYVSLFKATSIVSLIAVEDIMYRISMINAEQMRPLPLYTGVALFYCLIIITASQIVQRLTDRWRRQGWA
jgi:polar amino acid transport system permease protein